MLSEEERRSKDGSEKERLSKDTGPSSSAGQQAKPCLRKGAWNIDMVLEM